MRKECNIIRDLLPLYAENMVSPDTADFVEEHLKGCASCKQEYERAKEPQPVREDSGAAPLLNLSRKLLYKRVQTVAVTALFVAALLISAFAALDAPLYLPYSEDLITMEPLGSSGMVLTFNEEVTDFRYRVYDDPDGGDFCYCDIEVWTSLWDQWFSQGKGNLSVAVTENHAKPMIAVYLPNDGTEDICIGKYEPNSENPITKDGCQINKITLPRLALGYYSLFAAAALAILGILWVLAKKKPKLRVWIERIGFYPAAYLISHCIVSGISWTSYSLPRDFSLILFLSILLYSGLLLAHNIWRLKREIKEIHG